MRCKKETGYEEKNTTVKKKNQRAQRNTKNRQARQMASKERLTIGLDLGDITSRYCILNEAGEVVSEGSVATSKVGISSLFGKMASSRVALEVGTHSPWVVGRSRATGTKRSWPIRTR